jgi:hypothetical protein
MFARLSNNPFIINLLEAYVAQYRVKYARPYFCISPHLAYPRHLLLSVNELRNLYRDDTAVIFNTYGNDLAQCLSVVTDFSMCYCVLLI